MTQPQIDHQKVTLCYEGKVDGVHYVTVLDAGGNPLEYNLTVSEAHDRYPNHPVYIA
jgi:hypothetical protein